MDVHQFVGLIEQRLYPQLYTYRADSLPEEIHLMLSVKRGMLARYALAVTSWDMTQNGQAFLETRRRATSRRFGAMWILREVGLYLVICGAQPNWQSHVARMPADKTGLHAVIMQAVHFVDPESGESHLNQSAWGPMSLGGVDSIAPIIDSAAASSKR